MTHRFPLKEIARQAGLGTATVDRAINNRAHVSPQTQARVTAAIAELKAQETQLSARGRRMFFDFVTEAPSRFSREIQTAAEKILPQIGPAVCRPRFLSQEIMSETEVLSALNRIAKRGSHGICLKARNLPAIRDAVDNLIASGIPVVTLVTDILPSQRTAYVGLDNHSAGRTAAFLIAQTVGQTTGTILATRSNARFQGEEARETAFRETLGTLCPNLHIIDINGGNGIHYETAKLMHKVVDQLTNLRGVYSMGGGNKTILDVLDQHHLKPNIFVAHDLDQENRALIQRGHLHYVLHHNLETDLHNVFGSFLHHHKLTSDPPVNTISNIQVITPMNVPI